MKYTGLIGYVHHRSNMLSEDEQFKLLLEYGVEEAHIYNKVHTLKEAVKSCDGGNDLLVVWSAAVIGGHAYDPTITSLAALNANIYILKRKLFLDCKVALPFAEALGDIREQGRNRSKQAGRKKAVDQALADKIIAYVGNEGNQKEAAAHYDVNERIVSEIMRGIYF